MQERALIEVAEPVLAAHGLELDDLDLTPVGKRAVLRITVDGDGPEGKGPLLDDIAAAAQALSAAFDGSDAVGERPYTLEVSSRGVSKPLTQLKHFRRNTGRLVRLWIGETQLDGRIARVEEDAVTIDGGGEVRSYPLGEIRKAVIQVELNKKDDGHGH